MQDDAKPVKNKIAHIITGLNDGGAEVVLLKLLRESKDHEHAVVSLLSPGKYSQPISDLGVEVLHLGMHRNLPSPLKLLKLYKFLKTFQPNVVQTWMYHSDLLGGLMAFVAGVPKIVWGIHHTDVNSEGSRLSTRLVIRCTAFLSHYIPSDIISCSEAGVKVHARIGYPSDLLHVVPNGADERDFRPNHEAREKIRNEFGFQRDEFVVGCVARFNPQKDHLTLLESFSKMRLKVSRLRLLLVGEGMTVENESLIRLISKLKLQDVVTLAGARNDIPAIMCGIDAHALTSAFGEAFPNVICEAMLCGTPCVVTEVGDMPLIVGESGRVCKPKDSDCIARSLLELSEAVRSPGFSESCRERIVDCFSTAAMAQRYHKIWER